MKGHMFSLEAGYPSQSENRAFQPSWPFVLMVFLIHEAILLGAWIVPFPNASLTYAKANEAFYKTSYFWFRWDTLWYRMIAEHGYATHPAAQAFFPWVPLLIRTLGMWGAWGTTQVAFAASLTLAYRIFARMGLSATQQRDGVLLLALNPAMIFYGTLYPEPWTLLWTLVALEWGQQKRWCVAAGASFLAATTQAQGVLVGVFPLALTVAALRGRQWGSTVGPLFWGLGPLLGLVSFSAYLGAKVGNPLAWVAAQQRFWGGHWVDPWRQWTQAWRYGWTHGALLFHLFLAAAMTLFVIGMLQTVRLRARSPIESWGLVGYEVLGIMIAV